VVNDGNVVAEEIVGNEEDVDNADNGANVDNAGNVDNEISVDNSVNVDNTGNVENEVNVDNSVNVDSAAIVETAVNNDNNVDNIIGLNNDIKEEIDNVDDNVAYEAKVVNIVPGLVLKKIEPRNFGHFNFRAEIEGDYKVCFRDP
jgi:hypothetical protein